jgi:hypothetical protein
MWKELQTQLIQAIRTLQFSTIQIIFLLFVAAIMMGFGVMWLTPFLNRLYITISDQKVFSNGSVKQLIISEAARPGVNKTPDKKAHVYPFVLSLTIQADNQEIVAYPVGKNKRFEYLPEAIKYSETITKNVPIRIELRTTNFIDTTKDKNSFCSLHSRIGIDNKEITYYKNHSQYNSLTKETISWFGIFFTFLFSGTILFAMFLANNYSMNQKITFIIISIGLAVIASLGYRKVGELSEDYALRTTPIKLAIDVDQHYNPEKSFEKILEFIKSEDRKQE